MCMACEMDELWTLYQEQQAAKKTPDRSSPTALAGSDANTSAPSETRSAGTILTCDEPPAE